MLCSNLSSSSPCFSPRTNQLPLLSSHGSNVVGLQTTATFDEATDEFIINSPDITVCIVRENIL